ncbi:hypothetical protein ABZV14_23740 [Streptosporangium canum]|uniref:hypothetical protein n=1 Tax=Streptosporangium canum TaxID=324952 RepID=UPI0033BCD176
MTNAVQAYSYAGPSRLSEGHLGLSTSGGRTAGGFLDHPGFFSRLLTQAAPAADGSGSGAWELELPGMRYTLVLSPQARRGFSGEGAVLDDLSGDEVAADADLVGVLLDFEPTLELGLLAERAARIALREVPGRQPSAAPLPSAAQESSR